MVKCVKHNPCEDGNTFYNVTFQSHLIVVNIVTIITVLNSVSKWYQKWEGTLFEIPMNSINVILPYR